MDNKIISYLTLRKVVGILGIILSPVLILTVLFLNSIVEQSISAYYYTFMRDIMVGILAITGAFLLTYKGYNLKDNIVSSIAGSSIILVALIPSEYTIVHSIFAIMFFLSIAYMSYFQFTKGSNKKRNIIYKVCGIIILISILLFLILSFPYSTLILETIMLITFGISWLTKGRM